jgi:hypothetical protein
MHGIIVNRNIEGIVGAIVQGLTFLATQSLALKGLKDYPTSVRLIDDDRKQANNKQYTKHILIAKQAVLK